MIQDRQARIMELINTRGQVRNKDVAGLFQVSDMSARRLLSDMVEKGMIRRVGERKATFYIRMSEVSGQGAEERKNTEISQLTHNVR